MECESRHGESMLGHFVVIHLIDGNNGKEHLIVMDNYFSSVGLFKELAANGTYCIITLMTNCIGILQVMKNTKELNCFH